MGMVMGLRGIDQPRSPQCTAAQVRVLGGTCVPSDAISGTSAVVVSVQAVAVPAPRSGLAVPSAASTSSCGAREMGVLDGGAVRGRQSYEQPVGARVRARSAGPLSRAPPVVRAEEAERVRRRAVFLLDTVDVEDEVASAVLSQCASPGDADCGLVPLSQERTHAATRIDGEQCWLADPLIIPAPQIGEFPVFHKCCTVCGHRLQWRPASLLTECRHCQLVQFTTGAVVPEPVWPVGHTGGVQVWRGPVGPTGAHSGGRLLSVADFYWSAVRVHPADSDWVCVIRGELVVAVMPRLQAAWIRRALLRRWHRRAPLMVVNETDVAAYIVALCVARPPQQWLVPAGLLFPGHDHVFAPWGTLWEAGRWRPAVVPTVCTPGRGHPQISAFASVVQYGSPLNAEAFEVLLQGHPYRNYLVNCVRFGFPSLSTVPVAPRWAPQPVYTGEARQGMQSCVDVEVEDGAFIDITQEQAQWILRFAPLLVVPKSDGAWRLVTDLSWGDGAVNDVIWRGSLPRHRLAKFQRIFQRVNVMKQHRPDDKVMFARVDASKAFRQCPVPMQEFYKFAHRCGDSVFVSTRVSMGCRTAGDQMGEALAPIRDVLAVVAGQFAELYVDDLILVVYESQAAEVMEFTLSLWRAFGWRYSDAKIQWPATSMSILGVQLDSVSGVASVTPKRLASTSLLLQQWLDGLVVPSAKQYSKLAGTLEFLASVIPHGKVFLRSLYDKGVYEVAASPSGSVTVAAETQMRQLTVGVREDLQWWLDALRLTNGTMSFLPTASAVPRVHVWTDASGIGFGAWHPQRREYISGEWSAEERESSSTAHWEGGGVAFALASWGCDAAGAHFIVHSDSRACVDGFTRSRCVDPRMYTLLRLLALLQIHFKTRLVVEWVPGVVNSIADAFSRGMPTQHLVGPGPITRVDVPPKVRAIVGELLLTSPEVQRADPSRHQRQWGCLKSIVETLPSLTASQHRLPATLWSIHRTDLKASVGLQTSPHGSGLLNPGYPVTPSHSTSLPCVNPWRWSSTGSSGSHQSSASSCFGSGSSPVSGIIDSLPLSSSSNVSSTTPQSRWERGSQSWLRTTAFSVLASTAPSEPIPFEWERLYLGVMWYGIVALVRIGCTFLIPSPIVTTLGTTCTSMQTLPTPTALLLRYVFTSTLNRWRQLGTNRSLSNGCGTGIRPTLLRVTSLRLSRNTLLCVESPWTVCRRTASGLGRVLRWQRRGWTGRPLLCEDVGVKRR